MNLDEEIKHLQNSPGKDTINMPDNLFTYPAPVFVKVTDDDVINVAAIRTASYGVAEKINSGGEKIPCVCVKWLDNTVNYYYGDKGQLLWDIIGALVPPMVFVES